MSRHTEPGGEAISFFPFKRASGIEALRADAWGEPGHLELLAACRHRRDDLDAMETLLARRLWQCLARLGLVDGPLRTPHDIRASLPTRYGRWIEESLRMLEVRGFLMQDGDGGLQAGPAAEACGDSERDWRAARQAWSDSAHLDAHAALVEETLRALPEILYGTRAATDVLFKGSSVSLVERVYRGNARADYFNQVLSDGVVAALRAIGAAGGRARVLEIGAGTGGTSSVVFERIAACHDAIAEYCYTDLSKLFLQHAEQQYAARNPFLTLHALDVERHVAEQGFELGAYDVVIAANVLHATRNIRKTLRNVKSLLCNNGLLLLNEMSDSGGLFAHLTFGLTAGWWLYEDPRLRIPGCPALDAADWRDALSREGYRAIAFPAQAAHDLGLQIIVAESDGMVRLPRTAAPLAAPAAAGSASPRRARPAAEHAPRDGVKPTAGIDLENQVRQVVVARLCECLRLGADAIRSDESFADYGLDSITGMSLVDALNRSLPVELDSTTLFDHSSVRRLVDYLVTTWREALAHAFGTVGDNPDNAAAAEIVPGADTVEVEAEAGDEWRPNAAARATVSRDAIAIVGMSGTFATARSLDELWESLIAGVDLVDYYNRRAHPRQPISDTTDAQRIQGGFLATVDEFDPLFFNISGQEATYMDPQQRLFLQECWHALEDAGYAGRSIEGRRCGVFVGASSGDYQRLFDDDAPAQALWGNLSSVVASRISYYLDLHGPAITVDTACSSSLVATHFACQALKSGEADFALAGGVFVHTTPDYYLALIRAGMLSERGRCFSFDARADGFVPGEGAGVVLLRRLADAVADGDHVHGVIRASAINQDGATNGLTAPSAASQERLERQVYSMADIDAATIQLVEAHGTGTILGDPIEHAALARAFRHHTDRRHFCALGSIKSVLGHTQAAAGIAGLIKVLLALRHRQLPPNLHFEKGNPNIDFGKSPFFVNVEAMPWQTLRDTDGTPLPRRAVVSSFGVSGTNGHLLIEEGPLAVRAPQSATAHLIVLSARAPGQLRELVALLLRQLERHPDLDLGDVSFTLLNGRRHFASRLATVVASASALTEALRGWLDKGKHKQILTARAEERERREQPALKEYGEECVRRCRQTRDAGERLRHLAAIAELFLQGYELPFVELHAGAGYRRVPLPGYPFAREHYWVGARRAAIQAPGSVGGAVLHPLLHRNTSDLDGLKFSADFGTYQPALAQLEMARAAAAEVNVGDESLAWCLHDVVWVDPANADGEWRLALYPLDGDALAYEIYASDCERRIFSQGRAQLESHSMPVPIDLVSRRAGMVSRELSGREVWQLGQELIAPLVLSRSEVGVSAAALDDMLEVLGAWCHGQGVWPTHLMALTVHGDAPEEAWAVLRAGPQPNTWDADVCDGNGRVWQQLRGLQVQARSQSHHGELLLRRQWRDCAATIAAAPVYAAHQVLLCVNDEALVRELPLHLPADVVCLAVDAGDYAQVAQTVFSVVRGLLERRTPGTMLVQLVLDAATAGYAPGLSGLLRTAGLENPRLGGQVLVMAEAASVTEVSERLRESAAFPTQKLLRYAQDRRWLQVFDEWGELSNLAAPSCCKADGVYLITGGAGGLGVLLAEAIGRETPTARLVLTGRTAADVVQARLAPLHAAGVTVEYRVLDVTVRAEVDRVVADIMARHGRLDGIVHAAGINRDNFLVRKSAEEFAAVLAPKVAGLQHLDEATAGLRLDFLVGFSSLSGALGNVGQADYAAANGYMDGYLAVREARVGRGERHGRSVSINWPLWAEGGMQIDAATRAQVREQFGLEALDTVAGLRALHACLAGVDAQVVVVVGDLARLRAILGVTPDNAPVTVDATLGELGVDSTLLQDRVLHKVKVLFGRLTLLPIERLDSEEPLESYGIDSILITKLNAEFAAIFGDLSKTLLYEYHTLAALAGYFAEYSAAASARWCGLLTDKPLREVVGSAPGASPPLLRLRSLRQTAGSLRGIGQIRREPIAIVGLHGRYPQAPDLETFWANLLAGKDSIVEIPSERWPVEMYFQPDRDAAMVGTYYAKWGGFIDGFADFDPLFFGISPRDAYDMDPQERLFIESCWLTMEDAGYTREAFAVHHGRRVGVFAGITKTGFELHGPGLWSQGEAVNLHTSFGSVANRVSYLLNLSGPSMPIDTMCSASLTAIHEACEHLLRGECELALVGGVNLYLHPANFVGLSVHRMLASDGRCKSFGTCGDGFVPGEGVGTMLLKPQSAAERDGDTIHALIRGTAINHGGKTNGYTVPSPAAQADLIRSALKRAGVDARTVSYIEAHGTGTALGDPIEIAGLTQAFATDTSDRQFCAIGSVKTNIGHLEAAAGIAGLTKLLLQMRHRCLVPSLHARVLNPNIDFATTPFVVQQVAAAWRRPVIAGREYPRIAGVSSFGAGGANAHVVIEEYEAPLRIIDDDVPALVLLSAKTTERLQTQVERLLVALKSGRYGPGDLASIGYTLQVGREAMEERLALIAGSLDELETMLQGFLAGYGAEFADLYRGQVKRHKDALAVFEADEDLQRAIASWVHKGKYGKLLDLWVKGLVIDWSSLHGSTPPRRISLPGYPFARERYWLPASALPNLRVAQDALLHPLLHRNTSDLAEQRYSSSFSGDEFFFADHMIGGRAVLPGVAYLEMARAAVARASVSAIQRPVVLLSNVAWVRPIFIDKADPGACEVHVTLHPHDDVEIAFEIYTRAADGAVVVHCQGMATLSEPFHVDALNLGALAAECPSQPLPSQTYYENFERIGMSYGPRQRGMVSVHVGTGQVLAHLRLPAEVQDTTAPYMLHPSLLDSAFQATVALADPGRRSDAGPLLPFALGSIDILSACTSAMWAWIRFAVGDRGNERVRKVDIDLCDDDGRVCARLRDFTARSMSENLVVSQVLEQARERTASLLLLAPYWRAAQRREWPPFASRLVLLCGWGRGEADAIASRLGVTRVDHVDQRDDLSARYTDYARNLFALLHKTIAARPEAPVLVQVVVGANDAVGAGLAAMLDTARLENPHVFGQLVTVLEDADAATLAARLERSATAVGEAWVRPDDEAGLARGWKELVVTQRLKGLWKACGTYLITGGAGGLGLVFAREIAQRCEGVRLILTGRSAAGQALDAALVELGELGADAVYRQVDVVDGAALRRLIRDIEHDYGGLQGVLHSAGLIRDNFILKKPVDELDLVLAPKVAGLVNLDAATAHLPLDFFVMFASVAGAVGNIGQVDYAAANAFMDSFAHYRSGLAEAGLRHGRSLSIDWPLWAAGGMHVDASTEKMMRERVGMDLLSNAAGIAAFYQAMASDREQVVVLYGAVERMRHAAETFGRFVPVDTAVAVPSPSQEGPLRTRTVAYFKRLLAGVLRLPAQRIEADAPLENYGIDSIMVMDLTNELERHFGSLSKTLFFEYQNIDTLVDYFLRAYPAPLAALVGMAAVPRLAETLAVVASVPSMPVRAAARPRFAAQALREAVPVGQQIAIIGVAGRYPQAPTLEAFWDNLRAGRDSVTEIPATRWDAPAQAAATAAAGASKPYCRWGGFLDGVDEFDPLFFNISPREAQILDPQERLFLQCAFATLEDAGYTRGALRADGGAVGVYVGVMYEEYPFYGVEAQRDGQPLALSGSAASIANRVSYFCDFHGPSLAIDSMCSSSLATLHLACESLARGECTVALAGGVNVSIHPNKYLQLQQGQFSSSTGRCESFGRGGDGYVPGEGVGAVLLKPRAQAERDGDRIHALIQGTAINHGGKTNGYTVPNPQAQGAVIEQALRRAGVEPGWISYIEAHGTGTALGDPIEITGLNRAFGTAVAAQSCAIGSVKSNIGHCESAAGVAGLTKVLLQLRHGLIAPSLHSAVLNPNIDFAASPFTVVQQLTPWLRPQREVDGQWRELARFAGISSFGAGGANAHVVVEEYPAVARVGQAGTQAIVLSARTVEQLQERARQLVVALAQYQDGDLADIAYTLQVGREAMEERLGLLADDLDGIRVKLTAWLAGRDEEIDDLHSGQVKSNKPALAVFASDEEFQETLAKWVARGKLGKLVEVWTRGIEVDWHRLPNSQRPRRIGLPTYPFARKSYWVPRDEQTSARRASALAAAPHRSVLAKHWFEQPVGAPADRAQAVLLIIGTPATHALGQSLARALDRTALWLGHADGATAPDEFDAYITASGQAAYERLREALAAAVAIDVVDLTAYDADYEASIATEWGKLALLQALIERHRHQVLALWQITYRLTPCRLAATSLQGARSVGLYRMLSAEYTQLRSSSVDSDVALAESEKLGAQMASEIDAAADRGAPGECCYRDGVRLLPRFAAVDVLDAFPGNPPIPEQYQAADIALITGGTRGIGAEIAALVVARGVRRLVLTGREALPPRADWPQFADRDDASGEKLRRLLAFAAGGVDVRYFAVPLDDALALQAMVAEVTADGAVIRSVFHCAGTLGEDPAFFKKKPAGIAAVLAPKVAGLVRLHEALRTQPLDVFVLFSSVASCVPMLSAGQSDYAMANAFMDCYATAQWGVGNTYLRAIQWPQWSEVGMGAGIGASAAYARSGLPLLPTADALALLEAACAAQLPLTLPCLIGPGFDADRLTVTAWDLGKPSPAPRVPLSTPSPVTETATPTASAEIDRWLRGIFITQLDLVDADIDEDKPFEEYGVDSVLIAQITQAMGEQAAQPVDPALLFEHNTLGLLTAHFLRHGGMCRTAAAPPVATEPVGPSPRSTIILAGAAATDAAIAVVGVSCRLPGARDQAAYWRMLVEGQSAIGTVPRGRWANGTATGAFGGFLEGVDEFDAAFFRLHEDDAAIMDPQARVLLEEMLAAIYDAGYRHDQLPGQRVGVYVGGRSHVDARRMSSILRAPNPILGLGQNYLATNISRFFNLNGPSLLVDTACSSGLTSMSFAIDALKAGSIDVALVGAVSLLLNSYAHELFAARNILNAKGEFHIFDSQASGEVLGEGVGVVVLKRLADALRDGNPVYGLVRAIGINNDGQTLGPGSPSLKAQKAVMADTLRRSGVAPEDVGYIEVNGGGSLIVDSVEIKALAEVYRLGERELGECFVGSIKPNVGHLLLTSAMAGFIRCLLSVQRGQVPPFLSARDPFAHYDFAASRIRFNREPSAWQGRRGGPRFAAQNSFADGGTNCHVVVEEFRPSQAYRPSRPALPPPPLRRTRYALQADAEIVSPPIDVRAPAEPVINFWGEFREESV